MKKGIYTTLSVLTHFLLVFSLFAPVLAQTKRGDTTRSSVKKKPAPIPVMRDAGESCSVWRGTIEYIRSRAESHTKVTNKGEHLSDQHYTGTAVMKTSFDYKGIFNVSRSSGGSAAYEDGSKVISLKGSVSAEATRIQEEKDNWKTETDCFPDIPRLRIAGKDSFSNITESGKLAQKNGDGVMILNDNRFRISFGIPEISGKRVHKTTVKPYGWCMMEQNPPHDSTDESAETFSGERVEIEGAIDAQNPNILKGKLQADEETTIVWSLTRQPGECDEPLQINDLRLAHRVFPNKTDWEEITDKTVDGNQVRLTATVVNDTKKAKTGTVIFKETKSGEIVGEKAVSIPAESEIEVEYIWDTNGFAWTEAGKNGSSREIEASVAGDSETSEIVVVPKPVILVHGLWSSGAAWGDYHNYLEEAHSFAWKAYAVGADPKVAMMSTGKSAGNWEPTFSIRQNAQELGKQILYTQKTENAWRVDVVAHSMGGLISRYYIHHSMTDAPDGKPTIKHLVMLGTPNMGSPCADILYPKYKALGFEVEALRELQPSVVAQFNNQVTNRKGVRFSITYTDKVPVTCDSSESGDGVVTRSSAIWQIADVSHSDSLEHTALTEKEDFMRFVRPRLALGPKMAK
jgi:triacylglycerol esterase/lipase EstA (alpha/beta hydrolase family)